MALLVGSGGGRKRTLLFDIAMWHKLHGSSFYLLSFFALWTVSFVGIYILKRKQENAANKKNWYSKFFNENYLESEGILIRSIFPYNHLYNTYIQPIPYPTPSKVWEELVSCAAFALKHGVLASKLKW